MESRAVTDAGLRHEMYCEMETLAMGTSATDHGTGVVVPMHGNYIDGKNQAVKGLTGVPLGNWGGQEWPDSVWLDT